MSTTCVERTKDPAVFEVQRSASNFELESSKFQTVQHDLNRVNYFLSLAMAKDSIRDENSKDSRKNQHDSKDPPIPPTWTRCHAYLRQKHRFCRQLPSPDSCYCGNHQQEANVEHNQSLGGKQTDTNMIQRRRIPCPLDGSHTIWEDTLEKHVKVCPKARLQREQEARAYYQLNINGGGYGKIKVKESQPQNNGNGASKFQRAQDLALRVLEVHQQLFSSVKSEKPVASLTLEEIESAMEMRDASNNEVEVLKDSMESYHIRSGGPKHIRQQASLLGHVRPLARDNMIVLELGAGRGMTGLVVASALAASRDHVELIMVEREGSRSKADTVLRNHKSTLKNSCLCVEKVKSWKRIHCDLAHVDMVTALGDRQATSTSDHSPEDTLQVQKETTYQPIFAIAKHLCGAGTDLALKSLYPIKEKVCMIMMATCCHGLCAWEHYVGRDYLTAVMMNDFGEEEFELLRAWSAGSVLPHALPSRKKARRDYGLEEEEHFSLVSKVNVRALDVVQSLGLLCGVQGLGRACQRIIDYGRREYIAKVLTNSKTELFHYVPSSVTPQNAVLFSTCN